MKNLRRMIPEPDNKKGAFAPFHNRTVVIVNIICTLKITFQYAISAPNYSPYNQGLSFRFIILIGLREQPCPLETQFSQ